MIGYSNFARLQKTKKLSLVIESLNKAVEPDRKLDDRIWRLANEFEWVKGWQYDLKEAPNYTASIDTALNLFRSVFPDYDHILGNTNGGLTIYCQLTGDYYFGETIPIAILTATLTEFLKTLKKQEES